MEGGGGSCTVCSEIQRLPEECLSRAISLTSPRDACRSEIVSAAFRSAAVSDDVWRSLLPSDYAEILARAVNPVQFGSMKELYFRVCDPILIDGGNMGFYVDRESGKKCFILAARELSIVWGETPKYWRWIHRPESRFAEVAELRIVWWLEIRGRISSKMLSKHSHYSAYLLFKLSVSAGGLSHPLQNASVTIGGAQASNHSVRLMEQQYPARHRQIFRRPRRYRNFLPPANLPPQQPENYPNPPNIPPVEPEQMDEGGENQLQRDLETVGRPQTRQDGWMEILLGDFYNKEGDDGEVVMSLIEVNCGFAKSGLIVQGIEIRSKKSESSTWKDI